MKAPNLKFLLLLSASALVLPTRAVRAQGDDSFEDLDIPADKADGGGNFDDFDFDDTAKDSAKSKDKSTAKEGTPKDDFPADDLDSKGSNVGDADLEKEFDSDTLSDNSIPDDLDSDVAREPETPPPGDELTDENTDDLEGTLGEAEGQQGPKEEKDGLPDTLLGSSNEVFDPNDPSYQFSRVPLLPPMSDQNWHKWAGPGLEKVYAIRKHDTLWAVSERLFGTPYLWPKVWQLNAHLGNPHVIEPKMELQFKPGNPNASPMLALRMNEGEFQTIPLMVSSQRLGTLESIEQALDFRMRSSDPPFTKFLVENVPEEVGSMPQKKEDDHVFYAEGDHFEAGDIADGDYHIMRVIKPEGRRDMQTTFGAYRLIWLGELHVEGGKAYVEKSFAEIEVGDSLVQENFEVPPLSLQEVAVGGKGEFDYIPLSDGAYLGVSEFRTFGIRLPDENAAPIGSLLTFEDKGFPVGTGLVIHREGRFATVWLAESTKEISGAVKLR